MKKILMLALIFTASATLTGCGVSNCGYSTCTSCCSAFYSTGCCGSTGWY